MYSVVLVIFIDRFHFVQFEVIIKLYSRTLHFWLQKVISCLCLLSLNVCLRNSIEYTFLSIAWVDSYFILFFIMRFCEIPSPPPSYHRTNVKYLYVHFHLTNVKQSIPVVCAGGGIHLEILFYSLQTHFRKKTDVSIYVVKFLKNAVRTYQKSWA